ncbi:DUF2892 domain-containing protein [Halorientalis halophila]|uniref:DUF2892 domain-containing protein n=1 Tax=Halorientalis halophila TaxID=3108499 RepID=UPI00300A91ED
MELPQYLGDRNRLTRALLAVGLAVYALLSLRKGKRLRGGLAGLGAVALGYATATESGDVTESFAAGLGTESTTESGQLRCAMCGEPIVPGQRRQPNENDETVHEACLEAPA